MVMLPTTYLLNHIEALLRLSHDAKDRAVSAKLREMADELRIMVSVADITDFAAEVSQKAVPAAAGPIGAGPVSTGPHPDEAGSCRPSRRIRSGQRRERGHGSSFESLRTRGRCPRSSP
jgi:hypothetical protein